MTRIVVHKKLALPADQAERLLRSYLDRRRDEQGDVALSLRASLPRQSINELTLSHDVSVRITNGRDESGLNPTLRIEWTPVGGGLYPRFRGVLNVLSDANPAISHLEIDGTYSAPGDGFGELFDVVAGSKLAQSSLDDLLSRLAQELVAVPR